MNKSWQVVLAFVVVFLAGGAIGSVFTLRYVQKPVAPLADSSANPYRPPEDIGPNLMRRWLLAAQGNQFKLAPPQREKIRSIIFDTGEDIQRLKVEDANSARLLMENMQDQIAAVLNPTQRDRYYQHIQAQRDLAAKAVKEWQRRTKQLPSAPPTK